MGRFIDKYGPLASLLNAIMVICVVAILASGGGIGCDY